MSDFAPTARTSLRRHRERGRFDREQVYAILDEAFICHVAASVDGSVHVLPTAYGRRGDRLFLHGAAANQAGLAEPVGAHQPGRWGPWPAPG